MARIFADARNRDLFRASRHDGRVKMIANEISRGGKGLEKLLEDCTIREIASGLQYFMICLKKPLVPPHIQALALDENPGIAPELIAQDVLGLLKEETHGRHASLIEVTLDLLHYVIKCSPADELAGCSVPISMLPIFFNLQAEHISQWRRVAMIFVEVIRFAPMYYEIETDDGYDNDGMLDNLPFRNRGINHALIQQRLLEMNVVLRRYIMRTGNRGDSCCYEVYHQRSNSPNSRLARLFGNS